MPPRRWIEFPITVGWILAATLLFAAVHWYARQHDTTILDAQWRLGAVAELVKPAASEDTAALTLWYGLTGPFDVWDGQWWRVGASAFHHAGIAHLAMNSLAILFLGALLEPLCRRWAYLAFMASSTYVALLPDFLLGHTHTVGLSGVGYAMFGALIFARRHDETVAEFFNESVVKGGFVWLFVCVFLTYADILRIANVAHFTGLAYGCAAGYVLFGDAEHRRAVRWAFGGSHFLVVAGLYFLVHPVWSGTYYWYRAAMETDLQKSFAYVERAVALDPSLGPPRIELAQQQLASGDLLAAWKTVLEGLDRNRTFQHGVEVSRHLWKEMKTEFQRREALQILEETFQGERDAWMQRLGIDESDVVAFDDPFRNRLQSEDSDGDHFLLGRPVVLPATIDNSEELRQRELGAPPIDPHARDSALEGVTL